jgi:transcriptional regulator with XRE-family HTH domain
MRVGERETERRRLDKELRFFRMAGKQENCTQNLLRAVRQVMGVPVAEIAREMGVNNSVIFRLEQSEERGTISMEAMVRVAGAMECKLVYGIVPLDGGTLEELVESRKWSKLLGFK